jgi:hypothetical protein
MSASKRRSGFESAGPPPAESEGRLTPAQFQELGFFFKKLLDDSPLKKWIVLAGIGAGVELLHIAWLAIRFLAGF